MRAYIKNGSFLLLAGWLAYASVFSAAASGGRRARAVAAYERAANLRIALESKPELERQETDYQQAIKFFKSVYHTSPVYIKTPLALAAVAELYEEMGRRFSDRKYFHQSIKAYQFLRAEYPQHRLSRDALCAIGEVYRADLDDPEAARQAFQQLIDQQPRSTKVSVAREKLKLLEQANVGREANKPPPSQQTEAEVQRSYGLPRVTDVRRWVGPNYSRIVIALEGEVKFEALRVANPDRLVFDLLNTRLSPALLGKTYPVEDGFLRQIRLGQYSSTVTRAVLDVDEIEDYSVFSLPNPFRLVIDIHGKSKPVVAEKPKLPDAPKAGTLAPEPPRIAVKAEKSSSTGTKGKTPASTKAMESLPVFSDARKKGHTETVNSGNDEEAISRSKEPVGMPEDNMTAAVTVPPPPPGHPISKSSRGDAPANPEAASAVRPAAPIGSGGRTLTRALGLKIARVVIDPGHGGHDTGCIGPTGFREKDLVLDVGLRLKKLVEKDLGGEVIMTRSDDVFIPLEERTAVANEHAADLFISIHANASQSRNARGIETYYLNFTSDPEALEVAARENATSQESVHQLQDLIKKIALTEKIEESHELAKQIQHEVSSRLQQAGGEQRDRGIRKAPFVVLIGANMPSILAEISFLTNPRDERLLKKGDYREKVAEALYSGMARYVENLGGVAVAQKLRESGAPSKPPMNRSPATGRPNF